MTTTKTRLSDGWHTDRSGFRYYVEDEHIRYGWNGEERLYPYRYNQKYKCLILTQPRAYYGALSRIVWHV